MKIGNHFTHEAADAYPMLQGADMENFTASIEENGQREPIVIYQERGHGSGDVILDGRNRYAACLALGIEPRFRYFDDKTEGDPVAYVKSMNNDRRHQEQLSRVLSLQRIVAIDKAGRKRTKQDALPGVDLATSDMARRIDQDGTPELVAAVHRGEVDAASAAALSQLEPDEQAEGIKRLTQADEVKPEPVRAKQTEETCQSVLVRLSPVEIAALRCLALLGDKSVHGEAREGSKVLRRIVPGVGR